MQIYRQSKRNLIKTVDAHSRSVEVTST